MKTLVTGATGFIGRHLVKRLSEQGENIRALVRPNRDAGWLAALGVEVVRGDLTDPAAVAQAIKGCEVVFHLAAKTEGTGVVSRGDVRLANVEGTQHIADAASQAGVGRLVFASSVAVYGRVRPGETIDEATRAKPDSPYGESKLAGERIVARHIARGLPVVVARISTVWGPGTKSWLPFFQTVASGRFHLMGDGSNYHHIADVSDIVDGLLLCGSVKAAERNTYILTGPEAVRLRDLLHMICEELGAPKPHGQLPVAPLKVYRALDQLSRVLVGRHLPRADRLSLFLGDRRFDISRARHDLGYTPTIGTTEVIHRMVQWFRAQGHPLRG
jgi:nucleoside-diphosphate-sugar epimerase